ncbi:hypothetical protein [Streptomyces sp. WM6378]|uniref:hypothetical protein n=1 Tax=Streptomyces sp. WM6378 TaxID=1415557 RepID=UPI0006AFDC0A|nr:hypothetical protein [Streptomyces sp. WM6378]KOU50108.1 hypothetical protein ADK54_10160 [Streptomyces sp. WM6378]
MRGQLCEGIEIITPLPYRLVGGGCGALVAKADPEADREIAHEIIKARAGAYPLPGAVRGNLPLAP